MHHQAITDGLPCAVMASLMVAPEQHSSLEIHGHSRSPDNKLRVEMCSSTPATIVPSDGNPEIVGSVRRINTGKRPWSHASPGTHLTPELWRYARVDPDLLTLALGVGANVVR